jgi:hypothetical protein
MEKQKEERLLKEKKERKKRKRQNQMVGLLKMSCYSRPWEWTSVSCIILQTILVVLKLDHVMTTSWALIFIPLYFLLLQMVAAPFFYDLICCFTNYMYDQELSPDDGPICNSIFLYTLCILPVIERKKSRILTYPLTLLFILWLVLLIAKINEVHLPWWGVFLPLMVLFVVLSQIPLWIGYYNVFLDQERFDRIILSFGAILLLLFIIFLAIRLDNIVTWNWFIVMVPLFVFEGLLVCVPFFLTTCTFICQRHGSYWLEDHTRWSREADSFCLVATVVAILVLVPLLTFQVLLAKSLEAGPTEHVIPYKLLFIPIFLIEGFGVCACCGLNIIFLCSG